MFRIGGIAYSPDHILAMLDPGSPHRCADRSGANDSNTHEYLLVLHENQPSVFNARSKTSRQKNGLGDRSPEWAPPPPLSAHGDQAISAKRRGATRFKRYPYVSSWRPDCLAGHVRFELRNVVAKYSFERAHGFPGIQPNSGHRDYSRLSCGAGETQLGPNARISAAMLARASVDR